ncbi:MAG TPA: DJ-1/PfpI family protein [Jatrophihabitans sp.]|nr:DJ-1/PfpI family protein [Jatrophihabitans sp.]
MRIAIALFDGAEELDFAGPWEVLAYWAREVAQDDVEVITVAPGLEPVRAAKGLRILPDHTLHDAGAIDVFVMPGGRGTRQLLSADEPLHVALRAMAGGGTLMTSVCTGSLVYAAAGLLKGRPATTYWAAFDELLAQDPTIEARRDDRFVDDGNVITAAGVSAGIDMALHLVVRLAGEEQARATRRGIQYDPEPPV